MTANLLSYKGLTKYPSQMYLITLNQNNFSFLSMPIAFGNSTLTVGSEDNRSLYLSYT